VKKGDFIFLNSDGLCCEKSPDQVFTSFIIICTDNYGIDLFKIPVEGIGSLYGQWVSFGIENPAVQ